MTGGLAYLDDMRGSYYYVVTRDISISPSGNKGVSSALRNLEESLHGLSYRLNTNLKLLLPLELV
jgi:hypothetical protein